MKRFLATIVVLIFMIPTVAPWLPEEIVEVLHTQQEAHHRQAGGHADHHIPVESHEDHQAHFDVISYFDNLHVDLKNPPHAIPTVSPKHDQGTSFIIPQYSSAESLFPRQSQGPPRYSDTRTASLLSIPVYLATQRLRI